MCVRVFYRIIQGVLLSLLLLSLLMDLGRSVSRWKTGTGSGVPLVNSWPTFLWISVIRFGWTDFRSTQKNACTYGIALSKTRCYGDLDQRLCYQKSKSETSKPTSKKNIINSLSWKMMKLGNRNYQGPPKKDKYKRFVFFVG